MAFIREQRQAAARKLLFDAKEVCGVTSRLDADDGGRFDQGVRENAMLRAL